MQPARDDAATIEYHRGMPLPVHPPLLAPEPPRGPRPAPMQVAPRPHSTLPTPGPVMQLAPRPHSTLPTPGPVMQLAPRPGPAPAWGAPAPCTTCPFRQPPDRTLILPDQQPASPQVATQLIPAGATGSTTILQAVAPPPIRRPPPPPPSRRSYLVPLQVGLWIVITVGLLILALRPSP